MTWTGSYEIAFRRSQETLQRLMPEEYPLKMYKALAAHDVSAWTLSKYRKITGDTSLRIKDGITIQDSVTGRHYVIYNDNMYRPRKRFTLAHELGHVVFRHPELFCKHKLDKSNYTFAEEMCDIFAINFLAPPVLIREVLQGEDFNAQIVKAMFGLSSTAASRHKVEYERWLIAGTLLLEEQRILTRFRATHQYRECPSCDKTYGFPGVIPNHCQICGARTYPVQGSLPFQVKV